MRTKLLSLLLLTMAGSAFAAPAPLQAYRDCLAPLAAELDDGISDAKTIGESLAGACRNEFNAVVRAQETALNRPPSQLTAEQTRALQTDYGTRAVLRLRVAQRKKAATQQ